VTSPAGRCSGDYRHTLWALHTGAERCDLQQLTFEGSAVSPKVSPDGRWIAFLGARCARDRPMPYLIVLEGGEARAIPNPGDLQVQRLLQWSSDGRLLPGAPVPRWPARENPAAAS